MNDFFNKVGTKLSSGYKSAVSGLGNFLVSQAKPSNILSNINQSLKTNPMTAGPTAAAKIFNSFLQKSAPQPAQKASSLNTPPVSVPNVTQPKTPTTTAQKTAMTNMSGGSSSSTPMIAGFESSPVLPMTEYPTGSSTPAQAVDPLESLRKALLGTYEQSAEEKALNASLVNLNDSYRTGISNTTDQRIPLSDITGQKASIERRYNDSAGTLKDQIALKQAERLGLQQKANKELELAQGEKPIELNGKLVQRQADGTYKEVFNGGSGASDDGFTLGEGQVRYDSNGNVIASSPKAGASQAGETSKKVLSLVNDLLGMDTNAIAGVPALSSFIPGSKAQLTKNTYDQLKSFLSLENRTLLKGSGAISDFEARTLEKAATKLGKNLSDKDFKKVLSELQKELSTGGGSTVTLPNGEVINTDW